MDSNENSRKGYRREKEPIPLNGTGLPFQIPGPVHLDNLQGYDEEIYIPAENIIARMQARDIERLNAPHLLLNRVVYDCIDPNPINSSGTSSKNLPYYTPMGDDDTTLVFESRFENGNLRRAIQVFEFEYDLILKFDVNTRGHTQWFYFRVDNVRTGVNYKFNIINLLKATSLYNEGMKPLIYSEGKARKYRMGWYRAGFDIAYYANNIKRKNGYFYTLTFTLQFNETSSHYLAYCYPYTYTQLRKYLRELEESPMKRKYVRRRTLCQSIAGNDVDLLTITSFSGDPQEVGRRKGVVFSARVHPGESNSSYMMKGVIDFLTGPSIDAQILRENFVFKIIPMLNPDGVINGNYRCSLVGVDLNRNWLTPSKKIHPTIWHAKKVIGELKKERDVILFCDLHGHSRKKNIFMYGCFDKSVKKKSERIKSRIFPRILWKISKHFSFSECSFNMSKKKESSARIVVFKEFRIQNSYTMEASFCGASFGRSGNKHFNTRHLEEMGYFLSAAILDYCDPDQARVKQARNELELLFPANFDDFSTGILSDDDSAGSDETDEEKRNSKEDRKGGGKKKKKKKGRKGSKKKSGKGKNHSNGKNKNNRSKSKGWDGMVNEEGEGNFRIGMDRVGVGKAGRMIMKRRKSRRPRSSKDLKRRNKRKKKKKKKKRRIHSSRKVEEAFNEVRKFDRLSSPFIRSKNRKKGNKQLRNVDHNHMFGMSPKLSVGFFESYRSFRSRLFGRDNTVNDMLTASYRPEVGFNERLFIKKKFKDEINFESSKKKNRKKIRQRTVSTSSQIESTTKRIKKKKKGVSSSRIKTGNNGYNGAAEYNISQKNPTKIVDEVENNIKKSKKYNSSSSSSKKKKKNRNKSSSTTTTTKSKSSSSKKKKNQHSKMKKKKKKKKGLKKVSSVKMKNSNMERILSRRSVEDLTELVSGERKKKKKFSNEI